MEEYRAENFIQDRLSLPTANRLLVLTTASGFLTFILGTLHGAKKTSYQFLAENAHRLPRTHQGWYFYHKTKNYRVMQGGIRAGFKYAGKTLVWTTLYAGTEASLDKARGTVDFINSAVAASVSALTFSWYNGFSKQLTRRTLKMSVGVGLGLGLVQDGLIYAKGGRVWYYDRLGGLFGRQLVHGDRAS